MYLYLSKIFPYLFMPLSLALVGFVLFFAMQFSGRRRLAIVTLACAFVLLWISSTPLVARSLFGGLEKEYPAVSLMTVPAHSCAVVLGGSVASAVAPEYRPQLGFSADRMFVAAQLYRLNKVEKIIIAAGNHPWSREGPNEGEMIALLFAHWGVDSAHIVVDGLSRNTRENAVNANALLLAHGCQDFLLITSAFHMKRALAAFSALGLKAVPVPADVRIGQHSQLRIADFLPSAHALAMTSDAIREWMGQKVYEWRGWN